MDQSRQPTRAAPENAQFSNYAEFYQNSAYAAFPQFVRTGGTYSQTMVMVEQEPIDLIDSALPDFVLTMSLTKMRECSVDIGDGLERAENVQKHTMMIYPAHTEARTRVTSSHKILSLSIPQKTIMDLLDRSGLNSNALRSREGRLFQDDDAAYLVKSIWRATNSARGTDTLLVDGLTLQLISHLAKYDLRLSASNAAIGNERYLSKTDRSQIETYVQEMLDTTIRIKDLARIVGISEFQLIRVFRKAYGVTPYRYILLQRLERAKQLLGGTKLSLAQIAYACGFSSQSHMNDQFKKIMGVSPGSYRSSLRH